MAAILSKHNSTYADELPPRKGVFTIKNTNIPKSKPTVKEQRKQTLNYFRSFK